MKFVGTVFIGLKIIGLLIHIWTLFIIYSLYGLLGTIVALFMPVISQIYLFIMSWRISGTVFTQYNTIIIVYIIGFIVWWILVSALSSAKDKDILS